MQNKMMLFATLFVMLGLFSVMKATADSPPNADFYWLPTAPYSYEEVMFMDNSTDDGYIVNWSWDFENDGTIDGYGKFVFHVFTSPGSHDVTLRVIDDNGNMDAVTKQIFILDIPPSPHFYWTKCNDSIVFNASWSYDMDGSIVNYTWNFGDGSTGYGKVVSHKYSATKKYNVILTVRDDYGEENSTIMEVDISNKLPAVNFYWQPSLPYDTDVIYFYSTSHDSDGNITSHIWNFGDGGIAYGRNISHKYADNGEYRVSLTIIDDDMAYNISYKNIYVKNVPPVSDFYHSPAMPLPNDTISFNSTSYDTDGFIANYTWKFGDGSTAYGKNVSHKYGKSGIYNVSLTIVDNDGDISIKETKLVVADIYINKTLYDPARHIWNRIGDGIKNATANSFIYVMRGVYNEDVYINKSVYMMGCNATISGTNYSIWLDEDDITIDSLAIIDGRNGMLISSNHSSIKKCIFYNNNVSINISGYFNKIYECGIGGISSIVIHGDGNIVENNSINGGKNGIVIKGRMNDIFSNEISASYGILIENMGNHVERNRIHECIYGIKMEEESWIENNTIYENTYGIVGGVFTIGENEIFDNIHGINATSITINGAIIRNNNVSLEGGIFVVKNALIKNGKISTNVFNIYNTNVSNASISCVEGVFENSYIGNCSKVDGKINAFSSIFRNNNEIVIENGSIDSCNFEENGIVYSNASTWFNSTMLMNEYALYLFDINNIKNCSINGNKYGVFINGSKNSIEESRISGNKYGVFIYSSSSNTLLNNSFSGNNYALTISFSHDNSMHENVFSNNSYNIDVAGDKIAYFYNYFDGDVIEGKPIIYMINESNLSIEEEYAFLGIIGCTNITIKNQDIEKNGKNIIIVGSEEIGIENGMIKNGITGVYIFRSRNISIDNCEFSQNGAGISSVSSYGIEVSNCSIYENSIGVKIFDIKSMDGNNIINGNIHDNEMGIYIYMVGENEIRGNIDSIKIDGSIHNYIGGEIGEIEARNGDISIENGNIETINAFSSDIMLRDSMLNQFFMEESNLEGRETNFTDIHWENSNIEITDSVFTGLISIMDSSVNLQKSRIYGKLMINSSHGNVSNCIFLNGGMAIINGSMTIWNSTFHESEKGVILINGSVFGGSIYNNTYGCIIEGMGRIENVLFHHNNYGLVINSSGSLIKDCSFWKNFYGIVANEGENKIYHNNFIYNIKNAVDNSNNTWNATYPEGGNYWDDYAGIDEKHGKKQNESGGDGIGDTPYIIGKSKDFYPLMSIYANASPMPNKPPVASFKFYPSMPRTFDNIVFIDTSYDENGIGDIINYTWNFGDGGIAYGKNQVHAYLKPGAYNVTLSIMDRSGGKGEITVQIKVANIPPYANFTYSPENATSFMEINFYSMSHDSDGSIVNYTWNFGDGGIAYGSNVSHEYRKSGIYSVILTVIDDYGENSSIEKKIRVKNSPPSPDFEIYPEEAKVGEKISFKDLSTDKDGTIVEWHWDFGDGHASNERNATHSYSKAGKYTVKLIVKDNEGGHASFEKVIEVKEKETPGMEIWLLIVAIAVMLILMRKFK